MIPIDQRPINHGRPNHGFENGIINRLIDGIILIINGLSRLINGFNQLINTINYPIKAIKVINRSVNAYRGQLVAGGPQVDLLNH